MRFAGLLLVLTFLFSGDLVRIHGHPGGAPASTDCAACVAGLAAAVETDPPAAPEASMPGRSDAVRVEPADAPSRPSVRQGGLRDPPVFPA